MRFKICLSYNGASFSGWQIQPNAPSVQETLQQALSTLLKVPVEVTGAGRTDAGVHACGYVAHFDAEPSGGNFAEDLRCKLNAILPHSIVVFSVSEATPNFHARFDARRREYTYFIHRQKDPFCEGWSWKCGYPELDFDAMNEACKYLLGQHDFACFEKTGGNAKTSLCTVFEAGWHPYTPGHQQLMPTGAIAADGGKAPTETMDGGKAPGASTAAPQGYWYFRIAADRFLRNMVRAIVGTLIEVGRGKRSPESIAGLIASGTRSDAGESVPAHALFLSKIEY